METGVNTSIEDLKTVSTYGKWEMTERVEGNDKFKRNEK